jgi:hypothetical protein
MDYTVDTKYISSKYKDINTFYKTNGFDQKNDLLFDWYFSNRHSYFRENGKVNYENKLSDFICFFINFHEKHGAGKIFLQAMMNACGIVETVDISGPLREVSCGSDRRRIDIVIPGAGWTLVIEHKQAPCGINRNPYGTYKRFIERSNDRNRTYYRIMVPRRMESIEEGKIKGWSALYYSSILKHLRTQYEIHGITETEWTPVLRDVISAMKFTILNHIRIGCNTRRSSLDRMIKKDQIPLT